MISLLRSDEPRVEQRAMNSDREDNATNQLLGDLEAAIMRLMWQKQEATVREVAALLKQQDRVLAYTTVMTVMGRLVVKQLLSRELAGKTHIYRVAMTEDEFMRSVAAKRVQALVEEFGDLAIAHFLLTVNELTPERQEALERIARGEIS